MTGCLLEEKQKEGNRMNDGESHMDIRSSALRLLKKFFGYDSFRPMQYEIIEHVVMHGDAVVLMPTGGGKSICYQIPALLHEGCAIVVSPLLALMKDQVDTLRLNGIPAAALNSMQTESTNRDVVEKLFSGKLKLLYISPERLLVELDSWARLPEINLIAIDEAHCISQWGHDFRPEYTKLSILKRKMLNVPVMALTATADKLTREDIIRQLGLGKARLFVSSFDRPNLSLNVATNYTEREKLLKIEEFVGNHPGQSGIIYCLSRVNTEKVADYLCARGYRAACYHAGLSNAQRQTIQQRFVSDDLDIICATVAFGMGIDKSNIRWVIHFNMPKNVECYYQEIGRAGRDGMPSDTLMFYSYADVVMLTHFVEESGQVALNREKLQRMQDYAEALVCRRRMLLSYFNERYDHDCGNCDVCNNPPERFDGTLLCQMAISAVARAGQSVTHNMLIDVLRGVRKQALAAKGLDRIKTFGAGARLSYFLWSRYILQMVQIGLFEIAYNENNYLKITSYGWDVVRKGEKVFLTVVSGGHAARWKKTAGEVTPVVLSREQELANELKKLRLVLARKENIPPDMVFSDKVIEELVQHQPVSVSEFAAISGISEMKTVLYSKQVLSVIRKFKGLSSVISGQTEDITLYLFTKGYVVEDIARMRGLKSLTVCSHFAKLIQFGRINRYDNLISPHEYESIIRAYLTRQGRPMFEVLPGVDGGIIQIALAIYRKSNDVNTK